MKKKTLGFDSHETQIQHIIAERLSYFQGASSSLVDNDSEGYIEALSQEVFDLQIENAELEAQKKSLQKELILRSGSVNTLLSEKPKNETPRKIATLAGGVFGLVLFGVILRRLF